MPLNFSSGKLYNNLFETSIKFYAKNEFWVKFALSAKLKKLFKGLYFENSLTKNSLGMPGRESNLEPRLLCPGRDANNLAMSHPEFFCKCKFSYLLTQGKSMKEGDQADDG
jgi:hypothetical protein